MIWSGFRPSDDPPKYSFSVPANVFVAGALQRLLVVNDNTWADNNMKTSASTLLHDIAQGIATYGVVAVPGEASSKMYAYEVDGLGNALIDFDDPNVPSLLAIPMLGWDGYNKAVYAATRARILSEHNPYFFRGSAVDGLGSPHTNHQYVWPLATAMEALTIDNATRQVQLLTNMAQMASVNGLMHESNHVDDLNKFSRAEFGWANTMLVVAVEHLLGVACDNAAEEHRLYNIQKREAKEPHTMPNGEPDHPLYYESLEATIPES